MTLKQSIHDDLKVAMKSGDSIRRDVIRFLESAIGKEEVDKKKREKGLSDEEVLVLITRQLKQRKDSIEQFEKAGRLDLSEKEKAEALILEAYLPKQMSGEEVQRTVEETIGEMGSVTVKDMGRIMGAVMAKVKGRTDGDLVRSLVQEILQK